MDRVAANSNVLLQLIIRGPFLPSGIPGTEVSVYRPGTKATNTHFAGTCHSWPVHAGLVRKCIMTPKSEEFPWGYFGPEVTEEQRLQAITLLYAPLYNSVKGEIWSLDGHWSSPEFKRRQWETAYGVTVSLMHRAMFFLMYPAFASEYRTPTFLRIWDLKQACEAVVQFMGRWGRLVRQMLGNRRRKVRDDVQGITRNYVALVGARVPGAPIANVFLSAYNAFSENLIVGEAPRKRSDRDTAALFFDPDVYYEEVTTSKLHVGVAPPAGEDDFAAPDFPEEDEEEEEEAEDMQLPLDGPYTLRSVYPRSLAWSMAAGRPLAASVIGSLSSVCGPGTLALMREIEELEPPA